MAEWDNLATKILQCEVCLHETWTRLRDDIDGAARAINEKLRHKSSLNLTFEMQGENSIKLSSNRGRVAELSLDRNSMTVNLVRGWENQGILFKIVEPEGHLKFSSGGGKDYHNTQGGRAFSTAELTEWIMLDVVDLNG